MSATNDKSSHSGVPVALNNALTAEAEARTLVFELDIPIRWGDMDAMGHVNNTVYFRYLEQVRISWFDALGVTPDPSGEGPVIINAFCTFKQEIGYPGIVRARQYVGAFGRSSVQTFTDLSLVTDPDTVCSAGGAKIVWVDFPKRESRPIPYDVRQRMSQRVGLLEDK